MTNASLPDHERRAELEDHLDKVEAAINRLPGDDQIGPANIGAAREGLFEAKQTLRDELDAIGEFDDSLVYELVLEHAGRSATTTERVDSEVVLRFEHGPMGDETDIRYAVHVTQGSEWLHIRDDDEDTWVEVWSN